MAQSFEAPVQPRAYSPISHDSLPLVDLILDLADSKIRTVRIVGRGIKTALAYLGKELKDYANIRVLGPDEEAESNHLWDVTVFASYSKVKCKADLELKLASWGRDEAIEYLMAKSPEKCKSVMTRLLKADDLWIANGSPRITSIVLDQMIQSETLNSVEQAVLAHFNTLDLKDEQRSAISYLCIENLFSDDKAGIALCDLAPHLISHATVKILSNEPVRYAIVTERIVRALRTSETPKVMMKRWPNAFTAFIGDKIKTDVKVNNFLNLLANDPQKHSASNAASLLVHNDKNWKPTIVDRQNYGNGNFSCVNWAELSFDTAFLAFADLSMATLRKTNFRNATLSSANFFKAYLAAANLTNCSAWRADFSEANMRAVNARLGGFFKANFERAILECSDLANTNFKEAILRDADLSNCYLEKAKFAKADLTNVNFKKSRLKGAKFPRADLRTANLTETDLSETNLKRSLLQGQSLENVKMVSTLFNNAILTGTKFRNCDMRNCFLNNAKMADIDWEDCDLRGANFLNCQFQMGSTRAGTGVDSPYPSHGTRTGYYTDDYDDHYFKSPEERRKANLCGCNLTGAKVNDADFYLVDLRGAIYDDTQKEHFQKCGAILSD